MEQTVFVDFIGNAALLLALSVIYEITYFIPSKYSRYQTVVTGLLISLICIAIMSMPFTLRPGLIYDTRSILISVTALTFGPVPTAITAVVAAAFRISIGGAGTLPGLVVILISALIGSAWRHLLYPKEAKLRWLSAYAMGITVHILMLACMLLLPGSDGFVVIRKIAWPVLIIYPFATVLLSMLLVHQHELRRTKEQLTQSEERFRSLFDEAPLGYQSLDADGNFIDVNQKWLDTFGYSRDEVLGKWFGDFLSPAYLDKFKEKFSEFKELGQTNNVLELLHKSGRPLLIDFEGKIAYGINGQFKQTHCILRDITEIRKAEEELRKSEEKYRRLFETMAQGVVYQAADGRIISANPAAEQILGQTLLQMQGKTSADPDWSTINEDYSELSGLEHPSMIALRSGKRCGPVTMGVMNKKLGDYVWVVVTAIPIFGSGESMPSQVYTIIQDITAEYKAQRDYELLFTKMVDAFALHEIICDEFGRPVDYRFLAVNPAFEQMTGMRADDIIGKTILEVQPQTEHYWIETYGRVALTGKSVEFESYASSSDKHFRVVAYQPAPNRFACTFSDDTIRIQAEEKLKNLSIRDHLTGIYNRRFFEEKLTDFDTMEQLPVSVIIADINGVKLVNDAFGHAEGDSLIVECASIMNSCCRKGDIFARIGGDEFGILMPKTDNKTALEVLLSIQAALAEFDSNSHNRVYKHSVSLGVATKADMAEDITQIIKVAEMSMYQRKLLVHSSIHSSIVSSIKATMFERSHETEEHAERLIELSKAIGQALNLSPEELDKLELLATLHDIGKVGISDYVLTKPGVLSENEWQEMRRHPEIGYRIAMSSPELVPIAEGILAHQERWNGSGYPRGLSGQSIPLLARIIAVVDAYDAMTNDRPYRKALEHKSATEEIKKNAGTQFDPQIAELFTRIISRVRNSKCIQNK